MDDLMPLSTTLLSTARDHTNANRKKRSHGRTMSLDSNDSSSKDSCGKSGKVRRKIQWTMKDLLSSTSFMTIDSNASIGSAEDTCATEATVYSQTSYSKSQRKLASARDDDIIVKLRRLSGEGENAERSPVSRRSTTTSGPKQPLKQKSIAKKHGTTSIAEMKPRKPKPQRKLVPRISTSILQRRMAEPLVLPSIKKQQQKEQPMQQSPPSPPPMQDTTYPPVESPSTPQPYLNAEENSSQATSLTPLSPMRLSFEYAFESPKLIDFAAHAPMNMDELDLATIFDDVEPSVPALKETPSRDISIVAFPSKFDGAVSPLSPSPMASQSARTRHQKPQPFVLERALTASNHHGGTNMNDGSIDTVEATFNLGCEGGGPQGVIPYKGEGVIGNESVHQGDAADMLAAAEPMDVSVYDIDPVPTEDDMETTFAAPPPAPARAMHKARSEPIVYSERPSWVYNLKQTSASMRSMRKISKSVPVDVDEVKFVDVDNNLQAIAEMAEEHLEQGDLDEALDVYKSVLRCHLEKHGYEHESVGSTLHTMASAQLKRKNYSKAIQISHKAIYVRKMALGREHPDVAVSLVQLGLALFENKDYSAALESFQEALLIRRKSIGSPCLKVAKVLNNIGCTWKQLKNNGEAILAFEEAVQIQKNALEGAPDAAVNGLSMSIASSLANLCTVKLSLDLYDESLVALEEAFQVCWFTLTSFLELLSTVAGFIFFLTTLTFFLSTDPTYYIRR